MDNRKELTDEDRKRVLEVFQMFPECNVWSKVEAEDFTMRRFRFVHLFPG